MPFFKVSSSPRAGSGVVLRRLEVRLEDLKILSSSSSIGTGSLSFVSSKMAMGTSLRFKSKVERREAVLADRLMEFGVDKATAGFFFFGVWTKEACCPNKLEVLVEEPAVADVPNRLREILLLLIVGGGVDRSEKVGVVGSLTFGLAPPAPASLLDLRRVSIGCSRFEGQYGVGGQAFVLSPRAGGVLGTLAMVMIVIEDDNARCWFKDGGW